MDIRDSVVIVTGAARGLGKAIAAGFFAGGAKVALADVLVEMVLDSAADLDRSGERAIAIPTDITDARQVEGMAGEVRRRLGPARVLVNNAGSLPALGPVWEADPERWAHDVAVDLIGTFRVTRAVLPDMMSAGGGYVVNLIGAGVDVPHPYTTAYDCAKAGVVRLTEAIAKEAGPRGIKTFALFPGVVRTAMTEFIADSPEGRQWRPGFGSIFTEGRDVPPDRAVQWCLQLVSGRADALTGRWLDATKDFDETLRSAPDILKDDRRVLRLR